MYNSVNLHIVSFFIPCHETLISDCLYYCEFLLNPAEMPDKK
jgi:hypothetical protein